jgi:ABC-2 type transport system permease protein
LISSLTLLSNPGHLQGFLNEFLKIQAFIKKDAKISISYKMQFVFQFLQIFFGMTIIFFIGKMLAGSESLSVLKPYGGDYFAFALIGLSVNSFLRAGLVSITNDIRQIMNQGTLEAMCATSTHYTWLMFCGSVWQFLFEAVRVMCYFVLGYVIFGLRLEHANWPGAILVMLLTAPIFLMLGINSCSILVVVKRGDPINWVFSSVGALLAGTMFPVSVLPGWLQTASYYFPLTHSLDAARKCLLTGATLSQVKSSLLILLFFTTLLIPVTVTVNQICMKYAKKRGAFSTH